MLRPDIYIFNPTSDYATANGTLSWQPAHILKTLENELANLPQYLATANDIVLVPKHPREEFLHRLEDAGFEIPVFRETGSATNPKEDFNRLLPWGWSPAIHHQLKNLKPFCSDDFLSSPVASWKEEHRKLFSRTTAREVLALLLADFRSESFTEEKFLPVVCTSLDAIVKLTGKWGQVMIKSPWGSSGRGVLPITSIPMHDAIRNRIRGMLREQGYIMAEPYQAKQADLGFLYEITQNEILFKGCSRFQTDPKGRYTGNFLHTRQPMMPPDVAVFMENTATILPEMHLRILEQLNFKQLYRGPLGIDTLIYCGPGNSLKINPCLEINWRFTMGHVALHIEKHLHPGSKGHFGIWQGHKVPFCEFAPHAVKEKPLTTKNGLIYDGFIPLTEYSGNHRFGAYLEVWR